MKNQPIAARDLRDIVFPVVLALFTLITRILCHGTLYFSDGPNHVQAILEKVYAIQPPGYWLFGRTAGFFPDPVFAISAMNITFSVAGVVVFYFTATFFTSKTNAFIASLAYTTIFYAWFSGEVHSTHTSQLLFPVAMFYLMLRYEREHARWQVWLAAVVFAIGAGMRPSDGVFLIPMALYWSMTRLKRAEMAAFFAIWGILCLGWSIPTVMAMRNGAGGFAASGHYIHEMLTLLSIFSGVSLKSLANIARYFIPIVAAMWPVLHIAVRNMARERSDWRMKAIVLWIVPGSLFVMLVMITDPVYLNFLTAALLLPAANARRAMAMTAIWNTILFVALAPMAPRNVVVDVADCYVLQYTRYGVDHHLSLRLPELLKNREQ